MKLEYSLVIKVYTPALWKKKNRNISAVTYIPHACFPPPQTIKNSKLRCSLNFTVHRYFTNSAIPDVLLLCLIIISPESRETDVFTNSGYLGDNINPDSVPYSSIHITFRVHRKENNCHNVYVSIYLDILNTHPLELDRYRSVICVRCRYCS